MKNLTTAFALSLSLAAGVAQAGSMADPVIEMDVIVADTATSSSSGTSLVALLAVVLALPHF